jgi:hypothetical protein
MSQVQGQAGAAGQVELADKRQAGSFRECLLCFGCECFPMRIGQGYLSHTSPFAVGNGQRRHSCTPNNLRQ